MVNAVLRIPHGFLRRHLSTTERLLVATSTALALYGLMSALPAYPSPWEVVVATAVFFVMLWSPTLAYFLAVTAALYPLYTLSLYLAVLFLAVALLGQRVFINNMGATLLVLVAPWLAQYHLEWAAVLLGGLWWGKTGGTWIGALAALWGQVLFGMAGQPPNWLDMMGTAPSLPGLIAQFKGADSLETLKRIIAPLGPNPTQLLYHLLQIALWGLAAALTGGLAETGWAQRRHPWRSIGVVILAAVALALANIGLARWLEEYPAADFDWIIPGLLESALYAAIAAAALECMRDFVEHPLAWRRPTEPQESGPARPALFNRMAALLSRPFHARRNGAGPTKLAEPPESALETGPYPPIPVPPELSHREAKKQPPDDIIKIELD